MVAILVVVGLLMLGVAIVAWATRPAASYPDVQRQGQDVARTTVSKAPVAPVGGKARPTLPIQPDAFAQAPLAAPPVILTPVTVATSDPFAHAPTLSDLDGVSLEMRK